MLLTNRKKKEMSEETKKPIHLKVSIVRDAVMDALNSLNGNSPRQSFGTQAKISITDIETGREIVMLQDIELILDQGVPKVRFTVIDPQIEIHCDRQLVYEEQKAIEEEWVNNEAKVRDWQNTIPFPQPTSNGSSPGYLVHPAPSGLIGSMSSNMKPIKMKKGLHESR